MLLINPSNIMFEKKLDIVDYISKGFPPRKKDFERVVDAFHRRPVENPEDKINMSSEIMIISPDEFEEVLRRIYENNRKKRNALLIGLGIAAMVLLGIKIGSHAKEKREQEAFDAAFDRFMIEHPRFDVCDM